MKLDSIYADYFIEYLSYLGRALRLLKSMYGMTNSGKLFVDELSELLIEEGFVQSQFQMSIYSNYTPDEKNKLCYLMLEIVSIGIYMKLLENSLWKL